MPYKITFARKNLDKKEIISILENLGEAHLRSILERTIRTGDVKSISRRSRFSGPSYDIRSRKMIVIKDSEEMPTNAEVVNPSVKFKSRILGQRQILIIDTEDLANFPEIEIRALICEQRHRKHFYSMNRDIRREDNRWPFIDFDKEFTGKTYGLYFEFQMPNRGKTGPFNFQFSLYRVSGLQDEEPEFLTYVDPEIGNDPK